MEFLEALLLLGYDRKLKIVYVVSFTEPIISDEAPFKTSQRGSNILQGTLPQSIQKTATTNVFFGLQNDGQMS